MKKSLICFILILPLSLSGCYGTLVGVVAGPVMGGPSLTGKLYDSEAKVATKIIGTPFSLVTGAVLGILPGLWNGVEYDLVNFGWHDVGPETHDLFDPWHRALSDGIRLYGVEKETDPNSLYEPPDHPVLREKDSSSDTGSGIKN